MPIVPYLLAFTYPSPFPPSLPPSEFPPITSDTVRMAYKETFNTTYPEYLQCKATTDSLQGEQARLSQQLQSVPADSEAAKVCQCSGAALAVVSSACEGLRPSLCHLV